MDGIAGSAGRVAAMVSSDLDDDLTARLAMASAAADAMASALPETMAAYGAGDRAAATAAHDQWRAMAATWRRADDRLADYVAAMIDQLPADE